MATGRSGHSGGFSIGVEGDRVTGFVGFNRHDGDTHVNGSILLHPDRDRHGYGYGHGYGSGYAYGYGYGYDHGFGYGGYGIYPHSYGYAAFYPYRYLYRSDYLYPYRPYYGSIYPWSSVGSYYDDGSLGDYYDGYHSVYVPGYSYSTYVPSYVSVYQSAPVIYRYHDVYTYHDEGLSDASPDSYGYGEPPAGANDSGAGVDNSYYENAPREDGARSEPPSVFSYDPPDGVGPPLDWAGDNTPLPEGSNPVDEGLRSFQAGDYDAARSAFVRTILSDERDGYAKFLYGLSSFALGDYAVTAVSWRRALRTSDAFLQRPPDVRALYDSSYAFDAQIDRLFRIARERQDDRDARFTLAYLLYATGEPAAAGELFERLAASDPADRLAKQLASVCAAAGEENRSSSEATAAP